MVSTKGRRFESLTRRRNVFVALAVAGVIAVAAIGSVLAIGRSSETAIVVEGGAPATGELERAPTLMGTDPITGETVSLADFVGKPVVVNIWANWCPGCRKEAPALKRLAKAHPEAAVLGIDFQDTVSGARRFYEDFELSHPSIFDPSGKLARRLGLVGMPTTIFLNAEHEVVARIVGETDLAGFEQGLAAAKATS